MTDALTIITVAFTAYLATNVDNLVILIALYSRFRGRAVFVTIGQLITTIGVIVAAWLLGEAAALAPVEYVGLLGLVPLTIGLYWAWGLFRGTAAAETTEPPLRSGLVVVAAASSLLGNSVDTLITMAVVIADSKSDVDGLVLSAAIAGALMLSAAARFAVDSPSVGPIVERYSARVAPFIMIAVGLYVLANTSTDLLPDA